MFEEVRAWWSGNDLVVAGVFITLWVLSLISWSVMFFKAWQFLRLERLERKISAELRQRRDGRDLSLWVPHASPSYFILQEAGNLPLGHGQDQEMQAHHLGHHSERLTQAYRVELESYLTGLATIGNCAPFIGLLGTVWGIMHALQELGRAENISLDVVAGPVGEALIATALGLFVAIPAVVGYNLLLRRLRQLNVLIDRNLRHFIHLAALYGQAPLLETRRA